MEKSKSHNPKRGLYGTINEQKATRIDHTYEDHSTRDIYELLPNPKADDIATADRSSSEDGASPTKKKTTKQSSRVSFPVKLHQILSNPEYRHIIRWMPHGRSWNIYDKDLLASVVCKEHFNHDKFDSFNRSVNGWGFKRLFRAGPDCKSYYHELFLRGRPELAKLMRRLVNPGRRLPDPEGEPNFYDIAKKYPLPPDNYAHEQEEECDKAKGQDLSFRLSQEVKASVTTVQGQAQVHVLPVMNGPPPMQFSYVPNTQVIHRHHPSNYSNLSRRGVARGNVSYLSSLDMPQPALNSPFARDYSPSHGYQHHPYTETQAQPSQLYLPLQSHQYQLQYPHHAHQVSKHHYYLPREHDCRERVFYQREAYNRCPYGEIEHTFDQTFEPGLHFSSDNFASHCAVASVASSYEESIEYQQQFNHFDKLESFDANGGVSLEHAKQSDGECYQHEIDELMTTVHSNINTSQEHDEPGLAFPTSSIGNDKPSSRNTSFSIDVWSESFEDEIQDTPDALVIGQHSLKQKRKFNDDENEYAKDNDYADSNDHIDHN